MLLFLLHKDLYNGTEVCYTYDNNGNILTKSENGTVKEYKYYEGTDRLASYNGEACEYDAAGNPTKYRNLSFEWSKGRQLTKLTDGEKSVEYTYDGSGLRRTKTSGGVTKTYDYENGKLIRESGGEEPVRFLYGEGGIIGIKYDRSKFLFRKNAFGDVTEVYNVRGELVAKYNYSAYGKCTIEYNKNNAAHFNPIRYRGYYYDEETGLYYLNSRYYDPETGRFLNADDISYLDPETINGLNLYAYCGNNPVMNVDPNGTFFLSLLIGGLIAGVISGTFNAINAVRNGGGFLDGLGAFVGGFITGAVIGAAAILGGGLAVGALTVTAGSIIGTATFLTIGTFAGGVLANWAESKIKGETFNWDNALNQGALTLFAGITNFATGYAMGIAGLWNSLKPGNGFMDSVRMSRNAFITEVGHAGIRSTILGASAYLGTNIYAMIVRSIVKYIFTKPWKDGILTI